MPGGWGSHIDMVYVYVPAFRGAFSRNLVYLSGVSSGMEEPKFKNWVYFEQIIVKSTQFGQNWVLFCRKWYTDGWVIGQKIGIEKVRFWKFGRHIHVWFWGEYTLRDFMLTNRFKAAQRDTMYSEDLAKWFNMKHFQSSGIVKQIQDVYCIMLFLVKTHTLYLSKQTQVPLHGLPAGFIWAHAFWISWDLWLHMVTQPKRKWF